MNTLLLLAALSLPANHVPAPQQSLGMQQMWISTPKLMPWNWGPKTIRLKQRWVLPVQPQQYQQPQYQQPSYTPMIFLP